jgi:3-oxoadipate enol-lactonase
MSATRTRSGIAFDVRGSGPAVLLLHEGIADRTMWDPQWESWGEEFTLVRCDHRGFGESDDPAAPYSLHTDAVEVLDDAGIERAAIVGASMGGQAAIDLVLASPRRAWALVAVAAVPSGWRHSSDHHAMFDEIDETWETEGVDAANELELRMWVDGVGRGPLDSDQRVRRRIERLNRGLIERQGAWETEIEPTQLEPPATGRLAEIDAPVLVVTGAHDQPSVLAGAAHLAERTGAETVEIADAAHVPSVERAERFDAAVLPFLRRAAPG